MTTFITRTQLNALRSDVPPANHGKPWTPELKAELAEAFAQGKSLKELMDQFQRNNNGIVGMLSTLRFIGYDTRTNAYNITHIGAKRMKERNSHPPPPLSEERTDWLFYNIVLTIINDSAWHKDVTWHKVKGFPTFRRVTGNYISRIDKADKLDLSEAAWAWCVLRCYQSFKGDNAVYDPDVVADCSNDMLKAVLAMFIGKPDAPAYFTAVDHEMINKVLTLAQKNRDELIARLKDVGAWTLEVNDPSYPKTPAKFLWGKCIDAGLNILPVIDKVWSYANLVLAYELGYPLNEKLSWWSHEVKTLKDNGVYPLPEKQINYVPGPHDDYVDALNYGLSALCNTVNAAPSLTTEKEITMNPNSISTTASGTPFETRHYVFGQNINDMTAGQLIEAVKRVENEITDLKSVKTKSTHIAAKIKELEGMLAKIVEQLDSK